MVLVEFSMFIAKLCTFYERKKPNDGTFDLWFEAIKSIPSGEMQVIYDRITKDHDTFPHNVSAVTWAIHHEIQAGQNINRERVYKPCEYCNEGLIFLQKKHESGLYYTRFVFRCDQCKQVRSPYPWGNKIILVNQGYAEIPTLPGSEKISNMYELRAFIAEYSNKHAIKEIKNINDIPF